MNEQPRNVTPDGGDWQSGDRPDWYGWNWTSRGRGFPWLGVMLVLVGLALLAQYLVPQLSFGTLVMLGIAGAFLLGWALGRSSFALIPGLLILALAVARIIDELAIYQGPGTTPLCLAVAFGLIWLIQTVRGNAVTWPLWGLAIFGLIGLAEISGRLDFIELGGWLWPLLVIGLGILLIISNRLARPDQPRRPR